MSCLASTTPHKEDDERSTGGPIAALIIAVPVSVLLWAIVFVVLFNLIH